MHAISSYHSLASSILDFFVDQFNSTFVDQFISVGRECFVLGKKNRIQVWIEEVPPKVGAQFVHDLIHYSPSCLPSLYSCFKVLEKLIICDFVIEKLING